MDAAEHFAWAKGRALELVDAGLPGEAMASIEMDLANHPGTAGILHKDLRDLMYMDFMITGPGMLRPFIESLGGS